MKKVLVLSTLLLSAQFVDARSLDSNSDIAKDSVEQQLKRLDKRLALSEEQNSAIKDVLQQQQSEKDNLKEQLQTIRQLEREQIDALLSEEQKQLRQAPRRSSKNGGIERQLKRLSNNLALSDEQNSAIQAVLQQQQSEKDSLKEQLQNIRQLEREQIEALLSEEQKLQRQSRKFSSKRGGREQSPKRLSKKLALSDEQSVAINDILQVQKTEKDSLKDQLKNIRQLEREQIVALLSEEQQASLKSKKRRGSRAR